MRLRQLVDAMFEGLGGPPRQVAFRVDAGRLAGLSYGHLARCHMLSRFLRERCAAATRLLMRGLPDGVACARSLGEAVVELGEDPVRLLPGEALVVDLPGGRQPRDIPGQPAYTVAIDDMGRDPGQVDVVLNSGILARPEQYPGARRTLLGLDALILPEEFEQARRVPSASGRHRVLATFGGSDPAGLTARVVRGLGRLDPAGMDLTVVLGPGFVDPDAEEALAGYPGPLRVLRNPADMLPLFMECDLAVCAGGRTLYELVALEVPALAVASVAHEAPGVLEFARQGLALAGLPAWDEVQFAASFIAARAAVRSNCPRRENP